MVFNYTLFYHDDDDSKLCKNKWIIISQKLSPILLLYLFYLLSSEFLYIINGKITIDGSLSYLIGLVICVASGVANSFYLISSGNLSSMQKLGWVFAGGVMGGLIYIIIIQFL